MGTSSVSGGLAHSAVLHQHALNLRCRLNAEKIKRRQEALLAGENVGVAYRPDEDPCKPAWQQPMP